MVRCLRRSLPFALALSSFFIHVRPVGAKERPGAAPATGEGPDKVLQQLDRAPAQQATPGTPPPPPSTEEDLAASWKTWSSVFSSKLRMSSIQKARGEGRKLSAKQAATVEKLRSMLTPYKALVVSGGVSLGSYQAGFLYYTTLILRRFDDELRRRGWEGPDVGRFRVVTGASAGSINGFLSSISGCRLLGDVPEQSPFYSSWIDVGLRQLREKPSVYDALFDHGALDRPVNDVLKLLTDAKDWSALPCDGIFGVTATRLDARQIDVNDADAVKDGATPGVTLARQTEKFLLSFDVGVPLAKPRFTSYRLAWEESSPLTASVYPTLGITPPADPHKVFVNPEDLATLLRASAAFPLAFDPVPVPLTVWEARGDKLIPHVQRPRFLDGGLLDNTPLRLAQKLLLSEGCDPKDGADKDPRGATILFSKSGQEGWRRRWPAPTLEENDRLNRSIREGTLPRADKTVLGELGGFVGEFIGNATDMEALEALELMAADEAFDRPSEDGTPAPAPQAPATERACRARRRIVSPVVPARGMPVAGQFLAHFGAFLERDFRVFDFYQGVVDAQEHAENNLLLNPKIAPVTSPVFACFRDYRALTNASKPEADPPPLPATCGAVSQNLRALLIAAARVRQNAWSAAPQDEFSVFLTALHDQSFHYQTLAHDETLTADEVQSALREELHGALHQLGRAQGGLLSPNVLAVSVGAKAGADLYRHYAPNYIGIGFSSGIELSAGLTMDSFRSATGRFTLKFVPSLLWTNPDGFSSVDATGRLSPVDPLRTISIAGAAELRLEIDLRPLGPVQLEVGLGYAVRDRTEAWAYFVPVFTQPVAWRHGPLGSLTVTLAQRIYVTGSIARWWQRDCQVSDVNVGCPGVASAYAGYEPIETTRWPLRLSGGWRAMW